ncbi:MAG: hypothetical protein AMJ61_08885 [Desulfobacterales bacterium SG8_35_2]|nr:MAG: hypothetical protein AMJ61_08885 [Desulfobacterales bacterium SG8_35_2]
MPGKVQLPHYAFAAAGVPVDARLDRARGGILAVMGCSQLIKSDKARIILVVSKGLQCLS